jgi:hypothetical protein
MAAGVRLSDATTRPCKVTRLGPKMFQIILTQGLNRQIRRMCEALGFTVEGLRGCASCTSGSASSRSAAGGSSRRRRSRRCCRARRVLHGHVSATRLGAHRKDVLKDARRVGMGQGTGMGTADGAAVAEPRNPRGSPARVSKLVPSRGV